MDKKQRQTHPEVGEDATQYGEFVSSYFVWVPLPEQKEKAKEMAKMTKKEQNVPGPKLLNEENYVPGPKLSIMKEDEK